MTFVGGRFFVRLEVLDPAGKPAVRVWELTVPALTVPALNSTAAPVEALAMLKQHRHVSGGATIREVMAVHERPSLLDPRSAQIPDAP